MFDLAFAKQSVGDCVLFVDVTHPQKPRIHTAFKNKLAKEIYPKWDVVELPKNDKEFMPYLKRKLLEK